MDSDVWRQVIRGKNYHSFQIRRFYLAKSCHWFAATAACSTLSREFQFFAKHNESNVGDKHIKIIGIAAHTSTTGRLSTEIGLDRSARHPLPLGCSWFTDVQQLNFLQILVKSVLTNISRVADGSKSCWPTGLIEQTQNKAPFISLHAVCSCYFGRTGDIMKLSLELHWNFSQELLKGSCGFPHHHRLKGRQTAWEIDK